MSLSFIKYLFMTHYSICLRSWSCLSCYLLDCVNDIAMALWLDESFMW